MAHAQHAGAEAADRPARHEGLGRHLGAVDQLHPVAQGIFAPHQPSHGALRTQGRVASMHPDAGLLQLRRHGVHGGGIGQFPAEEGGAIAGILGHQQPLLAVIHAEAQLAAGLFRQVQPQQAGAEAGPVVQRCRAHTDIAQGLNLHGTVPFLSCRGC